MVLVVEGLPYFGFPEKMREMMRFLQEQDDTDPPNNGRCPDAHWTGDTVFRQERFGLVTALPAVSLRCFGLAKPEEIPEIFRLATYQYHLPDELIAQEPSPPRDQSRLLVLEEHR